MPRWLPTTSDILKTLAHQLEKRLEYVRAVVKRRMGWMSPVRILPYRGFGNGQQMFLMGRVLEDRPIWEASEEHSWWTNVKAMYRRFSTDEIPEVPVRATFAGQALETTTDEEGYFYFQFEPDAPIDREVLWHPVQLELLEEVYPGQADVTATGQILVPADDSAFGVISDVDDTILETHAYDFFRMARITFTHNARTRQPLAGVSVIYQALQSGPDGESHNPFFYVSSSAWTLYDMLEDFLDHHDIPAGPLLLRDLGIDDKKFIKSGHEHKLEKVNRILSMCGDLPFVLFGDAGQDDPALYQEAVRRHPGRILAIYIRSVSRNKRNLRARRMIEEARELDVPMVFVEDAEQVAQHAAQIGLIRSSRMIEQQLAEAVAQ